MQINVLSAGLIVLLIYIFIDLYRTRRQCILYRLLRYSFFVYMIFVVHYTMGELYIPPHSLGGRFDIQTEPFYFLRYSMTVYRIRGVDWWFFQSLRLSFYNLLLLLPWGIFIPVLYGKTRWWQVIAGAFLFSLCIETVQLVLTYAGIILPRTFNVDDLILNTAGAAIGWIIFRVFLSGWFIRACNNRTNRHV